MPTDQTTPPTTTPTPLSNEPPKSKEGEVIPLAGDKKPVEGEKPVVPEKYADFKLPEGVKLEGEQLTAATTLFKESGLSQDAAQKMVDFHVAQLKAAAEGPTKAYNDLRAEWQTQTKAQFNDTQLAEVKTNVAKLHTAIADPKLSGEFRQVMDLTGVGDHPAFISFLNKLSEFVVEGKPVQGRGPSPHGQRGPTESDRPSAAAAMYPNLPR